MSSFRLLLTGLSPKRSPPPRVTASAPVQEYKPLMVAYKLELTIEGNIKTSLIPQIIDTMFLAWLIELFKASPQWEGCLSYIWKSMRDRTLDTLSIHPSSPTTCHMLASSCDYMGFTDGSCIPAELKIKRFDGSRSWELMSNSFHLIVISLNYQVTLQTFNHNQRNCLRNHGFQKLELPSQKEYSLLTYIGVKNNKPYYNHEKSFEKLLLKLKGPKSPRVRAITHLHQIDKFPENPPPYQTDVWNDE